MKVFFDTNVILEYLLNRKCADDVERILYFLCEQELPSIYHAALFIH